MRNLQERRFDQRYDAFLCFRHGRKGISEVVACLRYAGPVRCADMKGLGSQPGPFPCRLQVRVRHSVGAYSMSAICSDCGTDTTPCTGKRGCRHKGKWEYYMVHKKLWARANMSDGFLCVACLERRLGHDLKPKHFTDAPINEPCPWDTQLLASRKSQGLRSSIPDQPR